MRTLYDLFKVKENSTQLEIQQAYENILKKASSLPQNQKIVEQIQRIKIAYGILSDPEKRKKYDLDLATKRADELLENVQIHPREETKTEEIQIDETAIKQEIENQIQDVIHIQNLRDWKEKLEQERQEELRNQERLKKQMKRQERKNRRQAKKDQQRKREMEINAYGEYLQRQGYKVKYPWTWLRIKRLFFSIVVVIIVLWIAWQIPVVRQPFLDLYEENFIVKYLVDWIGSIFH